MYLAQCEQRSARNVPREEYNADALTNLQVRVATRVNLNGLPERVSSPSRTLSAAGCPFITRKNKRAMRARLDISMRAQVAQLRKVRWSFHSVSKSCARARFYDGALRIFVFDFFDGSPPRVSRPLRTPLRAKQKRRKRQLKWGSILRAGQNEMVAFILPCSLKRLLCMPTFFSTLQR